MWPWNRTCNELVLVVVPAATMWKVPANTVFVPLCPNLRLRVI
jgi:hypothetical protein